MAQEKYKFNRMRPTVKSAASTRDRAAARAVGAEGPKKSTPAAKRAVEGPKRSTKVTAAQKKVAAKKRASKPKMRLS